MINGFQDSTQLHCQVWMVLVTRKGFTFKIFASRPQKIRTMDLLTSNSHILKQNFILRPVRTMGITVTYQINWAQYEQMTWHCLIIYIIKTFTH